jgi:regulator of nonsense transcripts 1
MQDDIVVRWEKGLSQKRTAFFHLPALTQGDIRLAVGDELLLKYKGELHAHWERKGFVIKLPNNLSEEVGIELTRDHKTPTDCTHNFEIDFVWKATSYDRLMIIF